jgi:galactitol-specific phosphotransferase system IIC component
MKWKSRSKIFEFFNELSRLHFILILTKYNIYFLRNKKEKCLYICLWEIYISCLLMNLLMIIIHQNSYCFSIYFLNFCNLRNHNLFDLMIKSFDKWNNITGNGQYMIHFRALVYFLRMYFIWKSCKIIRWMI